MAEAVIITALSIGLGLLYACVMGKGLFGPASPPLRSDLTPPVITFEQARDIFNRGDALFVDARHSYEFGLGHIKGAISVPMQEFNEHHPILEIIPKDKPLVVYCDGEDCNSSKELAGKLIAAGYKDVKVFFGGWTAWIANNQPVQP